MHGLSVCEQVGLYVLLWFDTVLLWFALLGLRIHVMFESSI